MGALSRRAAAAVSAGGVAKSWAEITALAQRPGMLSLGQGAPDMGGSNRVAAAATIAAIEAGRHDQYSPVNGLPELREAISRYEARTFRVPPPCRESEVAVATSATEALLAAFFASADAGNEAVCCESLFEKGGSAPRKRIVILVTHQIQFLSSPQVDRVVVMDQGRITATGSYTELVEQGKLEFVGFGGTEAILPRWRPSL